MRTIPDKFEGTPFISQEMAEAFIEWYEEALGDNDKASDITDACYWQGRADAMHDVLSCVMQLVKEEA